jgi:hypothetical protein
VLTQFILAKTTAGGLAGNGTRARLAAAMQAFVRMYEPHEAREDTVVFPAFRRVVPAQELADLGQHFADLEGQQFGRDEFGAMVAGSRASSSTWASTNSVSSPRRSARSARPPEQGCQGYWQRAQRPELVKRAS